MSLVAGFTVKGVPVLLGDLLVSGEARDDSRIFVPAAGYVDEVFPPGSGFAPNALRQKLALISPGLCIGWCGNLVQAQAVLKELDGLYRNQEVIPLGSFKNTFDEITGDLRTGNATQFIGWIRLPAGRESRFQKITYGPVLSRQSPVFRNVSLAGSGANRLAIAIENTLTPAVQSHGPKHPLIEAVGTSVCLGGSIQSLEVGTKRTILEYFGGGIEVIAFDGRELRKIDDVIYVFFLGMVFGEALRASPVRVLKYRCQGDDLIVATFDLRGGDVLRSLQVIRPVHRSTPLSPIHPSEPFELDSKLVSSQLALLDGDRVRFLSRVDYDSAGIVFSQVNERLNVSIPSSIFEGFAQQMERTPPTRMARN